VPEFVSGQPLSTSHTSSNNSTVKRQFHIYSVDDNEFQIRSCLHVFATRSIQVHTRSTATQHKKSIERRSHLIPIAEMTPSDLSGNIGRSVTYDRWSVGQMIGLVCGLWSDLSVQLRHRQSPWRPHIMMAPDRSKSSGSNLSDQYTIRIKHMHIYAKWNRAYSRGTVSLRSIRRLCQTGWPMCRSARNRAMSPRQGTEPRQPLHRDLSVAST